MCVEYAQRSFPCPHKKHRQKHTISEMMNALRRLQSACSACCVVGINRARMSTKHHSNTTHTHRRKRTHNTMHSHSNRVEFSKEHSPTRITHTASEIRMLAAAGPVRVQINQTLTLRSRMRARCAAVLLCFGCSVARCRCGVVFISQPTT